MLHCSLKRKLLREDLAYYFCASDKAFHKFRDNVAVNSVLCKFTHLSCYYHRLSFCEEAKEKLKFGGRVFEHLGERRNFSSSGAHLKYVSPKHPFLQSSSLQHWFKNWEEKRKHKLTASTFPQAIGFWPRRRVQLWLEKIGAIQAFSGNIATCWSNIKEQEALERYKLITGNSVIFPEFQVYGERNPEDAWMGASPDGVIVAFEDGASSRGLLEIKCPFYDGDRTKAYPWKKVPLYYVPQVQGLMEIMDIDWMYLYCWTVMGSSLFRIHRDPEYWYAIKIALSDFWWKNVQPAREIYTNSAITDPLIELREFRPAPRHELCPYIVYESKRIRENSELLMREINWKLVG